MRYILIVISTKFAKLRKHFYTYFNQISKTKKIFVKGENLLGPDNNIEFLKHFINILLKNQNIEM